MSIFEILGLPSDADKKNVLITSVFVGKILELLMAKGLITEEEAVRLIGDAEERLKALDKDDEWKNLWAGFTKN